MNNDFKATLKKNISDLDLLIVEINNKGYNKSEAIAIIDTALKMIEMGNSTIQLEKIKNAIRGI